MSDRYTLSFTGWRGALVLTLLLGVLVSLSLRYRLDETQAEKLVRHYLKHEAAQQAIKDLHGSREQMQAVGERYQEEVRRIDRLEFTEVKIGRLPPDYFLPRRPMFLARVAMREPGGPVELRYFNLGRGIMVTGESSAATWFWVI